MSLKSIYFGDESFESLGRLLDEGDYSRVALLVDSNTLKYCYPRFMESLAREIEGLELIEIEPGEESKSLEVLANLWHSLGELQFDRQSLIINLGGGVASDLGGFMAATYMRGIDFVNFPTSLLAMADAAVGSKTGINFGLYKNRIGSFSDPLLVGVLPEFLESLALEDRLSGWAEMLKHGLISDPSHFESLLSFPIQKLIPTTNYLKRTIEIKSEVVVEDKKEKGRRKILNFGHSVGHALESYYASLQNPIRHGYAVALGMQVELYLSTQLVGFPLEDYQRIINYLQGIYTWPSHTINEDSFGHLLLGDKKNRQSQIRLVLLSEIGKPMVDQEATIDQVWSALTEVWNG